MKNKDLLPVINAIKQMEESELKNIDTALALIEIQETLIPLHKKNMQAVDKMVIFTDAEKKLQASFQELYQTLNESNSGEINEKLKQLESENKELSDSIKQKMEKKSKLIEELGEKLLTVKLPKIDKSHLPASLKLWQVAVLKPLFK